MRSPLPICHSEEQRDEESVKNRFFGSGRCPPLRMTEETDPSAPLRMTQWDGSLVAPLARNDRKVGGLTKNGKGIIILPMFPVRSAGKGASVQRLHGARRH